MAETKPGACALVIIDMAIARTSPAGSCVLEEIEGLRGSHQILAVSARLECTPSPSLAFERVHIPARPLLLRYLAFQWGAAKALHSRARPGTRTLVQATQGQYIGAQVCYAHFCHRGYLDGPWRNAGASGLRGFARWLTHRFNARNERKAFHRAERVVVPSEGLARELQRFYPWLAGRVRVIGNPVDMRRFSRPPSFDRAAFRTQAGLLGEDFVLCFAALGDFARKGLEIAIEALCGLASPQSPRVRLLVVGGRPLEVSRARAAAARRGLADRVSFTGLREDMRAFFWASDAFILPSAYEAFPLVVLQAAAAGLPVIATRGLYGVEEFLVDGENGLVFERNAGDVRRAIGELLSLPAARREAMSTAARDRAARYDVPEFQRRWREFYRELQADPPAGPNG
jgi:glycosyltransferase involved in cell wall biosynthesis